MANGNDMSRSEYLKALLNTKNSIQANGGSLVNPSLSSNISELATMNTSYVDKTATDFKPNEQEKQKDTNSVLSKLFGTIDELAMNFGAGFVGGWEGILDLGATGLGALTGNSAFTDWAKQDLGRATAEWVKTYANLTPWGIYSSISSGNNIFNKEYRNQMASGFGDILDAGTFGIVGDGRLNKDYREDSNKYYGYNDEWINQSETGQFFNGIAQSIGQMLPSIMTAGASASAGASQQVAKGVSLAMLGTSAGGKQSEQALNEGADAKKAFASGVASGTIEVVSEIFVEKALGKIADKLGVADKLGTFGKVNGISYSKEIVKKSVASELFTTAIEEGSEEVFSEIFAPFVEAIYKGDRAFYDENGNSIYKGEWWKNAGESFLSGALTGVITSGSQMASSYQKYGKSGVAFAKNVNELQQIREEYNQKKFNGESTIELEKKAKELTLSMMTQLEDMVKNPSEKQHLRNLMENYYGSKEVRKAVKNGLLSYDNVTDERVSSFKNEISKPLYKSMVDSVNEMFKKTGKDINIELVNPEEMNNLLKQYGKNEDGKSIRGFQNPNTGKVYINDKYSGEVAEIIKHEAISHSIVDSDKTIQDNIIKYAEENFSEEFHKYDKQLEQQYGKNEKVLRYERLATFMESQIKDYNSFANLFTKNAITKSKVIALLNRIANTYKTANSTDKTLLKQIDKAIKKLKSSNTNNTQQTQLSYSKNVKSADIKEKAKEDTTKKKLVRSPITYQGGKYDLLKSILPKFPSVEQVKGKFYDAFSGSLTVSLNVDYNNIVANDLSETTYGVQKVFKDNTPTFISQYINKMIKEYDLRTEKGFYKFESFFNSESKDAKYHYLNLFILSKLSSNRGTYVNEKGKFEGRFNENGGLKDKKDINAKIQSMCEAVKKMTLTNKNAFDVIKEAKSGDFIYVDPPYLYTNAEYNKNGGWTETDDHTLLFELDNATKRGVKWAMSNALEYNQITNKFLQSWMKKYEVEHIEKKYIKGDADEILIRNYDNSGTIIDSGKVINDVGGKYEYRINNEEAENWQNAELKRSGMESYLNEKWKGFDVSANSSVGKFLRQVFYGQLSLIEDNPDSRKAFNRYLGLIQELQSKKGSSNPFAKDGHLTNAFFTPEMQAMYQENTRLGVKDTRFYLNLDSGISNYDSQTKTMSFSLSAMANYKTKTQADTLSGNSIQQLFRFTRAKYLNDNKYELFRDNFSNKVQKVLDSHKGLQQQLTNNIAPINEYYKQVMNYINAGSRNVVESVINDYLIKESRPNYTAQEFAKMNDSLLAKILSQYMARDNVMQNIYAQDNATMEILKNNNVLAVKINQIVNSFTNTLGEFAKQEIKFSKPIKESYTANVSPYRASNVSENNYELTRSRIKNTFEMRANDISKALGIKGLSIKNAIGGFESRNGKLRGIQVNEISYEYGFAKGTSFEKANLFACLISDLGFDTLEAGIISNYVSENDPSRNGDEILLKITSNKYKEDITNLAKECGINNYTYLDENGIFKTTVISEFEDIKEIEKKYEKFITELLKRGYIDARQEAETNAVNSRYADSGYRLSTYKMWLESQKNSQRGELYDFVDEARRRAEVEQQTSLLYEKLNYIWEEKLKNLDLSKIKHREIVDNNQVKTVVLEDEISKPLFDSAKIVKEITDIEKPFIADFLSDTAKRFDIDWDGSLAQSLQKSVSSIADRIYRNIKSKNDSSPYRLHDWFRTTFILDENNYKQIKSLIRYLSPYLLMNGMKDTAFIDIANNPFGYKGIHLNLSFQNINTEIQLHTKESWQVKLAQDKFYDKYRSLSANDINKAEYERDIATSKSLNDNLGDTYYKIVDEVNDINNKFNKDSKEVKFSKPVKPNTNYKSMETTKDIIDLAENKIKDRIGKSYNIRYPKNFQSFSHKAFSEINSVKDVYKEATRLVELLKETTLEIYDDTTKTYVEVGTLGSSMSKSVEKRLTQNIRKIIRTSNNTTAKSNLTKSFEMSLNKMFDEKSEITNKLSNIRQVADLRKKLRNKIDQNYQISEDAISRDGLKFLLKAFAELHGSDYGFSAKGYLDNVNEVLSFYEEDKIKKNYPNLPYYDEIRNVLIDLKDSLGQPVAQSYTSKGVSKIRMIYGSLTAETLQITKVAMRMINHIVDQTAKTNTQVILPSAEQSYKVIENSNYAKNQDYASKLFRSYKRGFAPSYVVIREMLGGNSELANVSTQKVQQAINKKTLYLGNYNTEINKKLKEFGIKNKLDKLFDFEGQKLTADQMMNLYISLNVEANFNAINESGVQYYDKNEQLKTLIEKGNAEYLKAKITDALSDGYKKMGDWLLSTMNSSVKSEYIDFYKERFGEYNGRNEIGKINENSYWMLNRSYQRFTNVEKMVKNPNGVFNHAKSRVGKSNNQVLVGGALSGFTAYTTALSNELFVKPVYREILATLNTKIANGDTIANLLAEKTSKKDIAYLETTLEDILGVNKKGNDLFTNIMARFSVAKLSLNIGTMLKQFASIWTSNIPFKDSAKGFIYNIFKNQDVKKELNMLLDEKNGLGGLKYRSNGSTVVQANADGLSGRAERFASIGMTGISKVDLFTINTGVISLMYIVENQYGYKVGKEENANMVKELWVDFELSQIGSSALSKNAIARGDYDSLPKAIFGFLQGANRASIGSQINKIDLFNRNHNLDKKTLETNKKDADAKVKDFESTHDLTTLTDEERADYVELKSKQIDAKTKVEDYGKYEVAGGKMIPVNMVTGLLAQGIFVAMVTELLKHIKGKKDWDEWNIAEIGANIGLATAIDWIPLVNTLSNLVKGYDVNVPAVDLLNQAGDIISSGKNGNWSVMLKQIAILVGDACGIPVETLYQYLYGAMKTFNPQIAWEMNSVLYGTSMQSASKTLKTYAEKGNIKNTTAMVNVIMTNYKMNSIDEKVSNELAKLYISGYNAMPKSFITEYTDNNGNVVKLSADKINAFKTYYNQSDSVIKETLKITEYSNLTQEEKSKVIKKIYDAYYSYAKSKVTGQTADSKLAQLLVDANGNINIGKYVIFLNKINSITESKTKTRKELVVQYVNSITGMSRNEKIALLQLAGYTTK